MGRNKFQNISTILFDLDNTLINTKEADRLACEEVYQHLQHYDVRRSTAKDVVKKFYEYIKETPQNPVFVNADADSWRTVLWKQALGPKLSGLSTAAHATWREARIRHIKLSREVEDLLLELRKHYKLGLLSNGPSSAQWEKINKVNCQAYFDAIVVGGDNEQARPDPALFEEAFRKLDVSSLECAMVGDSLDIDIKGGVKSNCAVTVLVNSGHSTSSSREENGRSYPDFRIDHVRELVGLLMPDSLSFSSLCSKKSVGFFHSLREEAPSWRKRIDSW